MKSLISLEFPQAICFLDRCCPPRERLRDLHCRLLRGLDGEKDPVASSFTHCVNNAKRTSRMLAKVGKIGYKGVEFAVITDERTELRKMLDDNGLVAAALIRFRDRPRRQPKQQSSLTGRLATNS